MLLHCVRTISLNLVKLRSKTTASARKKESSRYLHVSVIRQCCRDIIQVRETFTSFCSKFIQEMAYQISSESPEFYRRYYEKHFGLSFWTHCITPFTCSNNLCSCQQEVVSWPVTIRRRAYIDYAHTS